MLHFSSSTLHNWCPFLCIATTERFADILPLCEARRLLPPSPACPISPAVPASTTTTTIRVRSLSLDRVLDTDLSRRCASVDHDKKMFVLMPIEVLKTKPESTARCLSPSRSQKVPPLCGVSEKYREWLLLIKAKGLPAGNVFVTQ